MAHDYADGISDYQINDMRVRAHQRALHAQRERARKAKLVKGATEEESEMPKNGADIMKKDMTTDHDGKIIQIRAIRAEKLPSMVPQTAKPIISQLKIVSAQENSKQMQALKVQVNQQIEKMRKEFINDGMGFRTLQKEG